MAVQEFILFYLPIIANVLIVLSIIFSLISPLLSIRRKTKRDIARLASSADRKDYSPLEGTVDLTYRRLEQLYENMRNQNNSWLIFSVVLFSVGVFVIIFSLILSNYIFYTIRITVLISGVLLDIIAVLFFLRTRQANHEIDHYFSQKFLEEEKLSQLIKLVSEDPNPAARNRLKEKIILQILIPMSEKENPVNDRTVQYYT